MRHVLKQFHSHLSKGSYKDHITGYYCVINLVLKLYVVLHHGFVDFITILCINKGNLQSWTTVLKHFNKTNALKLTIILCF